jgi:hypothetical protein
VTRTDGGERERETAVVSADGEGDGDGDVVGWCTSGASVAFSPFFAVVTVFVPVVTPSGDVV